MAKEKGTSGTGIVPSVIITKTEDDTVTIKTPKMVYDAMTLDSFDIENVDVTKNEDTFFFSKGEFTATTKTTDDKGYDITGTSLVGKFEEGILVLRVAYTPGSMPFPIVVIFTSSSN